MTSTIPLVGGLPILGALPGFVRDPFSVLRRAASAGSVCRLNLGLLDVVTLHHPDHVDHVLRKHGDDYTKDGPYWDAIRGLLGNGLPTSRGDFWLRQRRMMQPQFHKRRLEAMAQGIVASIDRSLDWPDVDDDWQVTDIGARMPRLTMNVVSSAILGASTSRRDADIALSELRYAVDHMYRAMLSSQLPQWVPLPGRNRFAKSAERLRALVGRFVEARRARLERGDEDGGDLLGLMLGARDDETGEGMTDQQVRDEAMSLFLAGFETTAHGLQWALYFLCRHPEHLQRLREEADHVLVGADPEFADLPRLPYARWVMQEALRINPPAWWLPRVAAKDDEIDGHAIAKGTMVAPVTYTIHRHPDFWPDPERFDPERFSPDQVRGRHRLAWVPFGAGPHQCIGQELALMEATLALAMITQRYELQWAGHVSRPKMSTVIVPADGVRVRVRRRAWSRPSLHPSRSMASESSSAMGM
ncbi:MAG: cytochrome P450 [Nannocystaceae bacterium]